MCKKPTQKQKRNELIIGYSFRNKIETRPFEQRNSSTIWSW